MSTFDMPTLVAELRRDEGVRLKPYRDIVGKLTIGVGRNLDDCGISDDEASALLANDIERSARALDLNLTWWRKLDPVRQRVLVNMCFNMGIVSLLGFRQTLAAIEACDWQAAHDGMLASHWAQQVGARAAHLAQMMLTGETDGTSRR